jgi:sulfatase maturation enzyme AslB (radical SAM superfamily)
MLEVKSLSMQISIDGLYDLQEYFRSKSNFEKIIENLKYYQEIIEKRKNKKTDIFIHTTVTIYNVNKLEEIKKFFLTNFSQFKLTHRVLYWPQQLSILYLPNDYKNQLLKIIAPLGDDYNDIIIELKNDNENFFEHFLNYHDKLDTIRKESLGNSNELLSKYIEKYPRQYIDSSEFFSKQARYVKL